MGFLSERPGQVLGACGAPGFGTAFGLLCDELAAGLEEPLVLVIDECHLLGASPHLAEGLETLADFFPDDSQLLLAGRGFEALGLAGYELRDEIVFVSDQELAFTRDEVADLVKAAAGRRPDPDDVLRISERTRGWSIAVAHAARRAGEAPAGALDDPDALYAYLAQEVFPGLEPAFRRQLLECAHLSRMDPASCRALLGPGGAGFLQRLKQFGTFVVRVGDGFEFHPLFEEFLLQEFRERVPEDERREFWLRLSTFAATPDERISFLQQAGEWARAEAELVEHLPSLVAQGWQATGWEWLAGFPAAWRRDSYLLRYVEGWLLAMEDRAAESAFVLREAERLAEARADEKALGLIWSALSTAATFQGEVDLQAKYAELGLGALPEEAAAARAACLNARGLARLQRRDLAAAEADLRAMRELSRKAHQPFGEVQALHNLGYAALLRGTFHQAIDLFRASISQARLAKLLPLPVTYSNMAVCYFWVGREAEALAAIEEGTALAERLASARVRSYLQGALSLLYERQGDLPKARSALAESLAIAEECGDRLARVQAHFGLAEIALQAGSLEEAQREIARGVNAAGRSLDDPDLLSAALVQAELLLRRGDNERARSLLAHASRTLEQFPNPFHECIALRLWAALCQAEGDKVGEAAHRAKARDIVDRFGYALPAEWPPPLPEADPQGLATIRIRCLGPFEARVEGRAVEQWGAAKVKAMLAYLALHPAGVSRQEIVGALYPDQEICRSTVHTALSRLREALEPECRKGVPSRFVLFSGGRYRLNPGTPVWCDVTDFLRLLDQGAAPGTPPEGRRSSLERAARLCTGPFLPEFQHIPWVQIEAERLRSLAIKAFEELLALSGAADDWEALEKYAEAALRMEACHHPSIRAMVVALAMQERPDEAVRYGGRIAARPCGCAVPDRELAELLAMLGTGRATVRAMRSFLPPVP